MTLYVALDIGCIECSEDTAVLGIFNTEIVAEAILIEHADRQKAGWHGQHRFELIAVPQTSEAYPVTYTGDWEDRGQRPRLVTRVIAAGDKPEAVPLADRSDA